MPADDAYNKYRFQVLEACNSKHFAKALNLLKAVPCENCAEDGGARTSPKQASAGLAGDDSLERENSDLIGGVQEAGNSEAIVREEQGQRDKQTAASEVTSQDDQQQDGCRRDQEALRKNNMQKVR